MPIYEVFIMDQRFENQQKTFLPVREAGRILNVSSLYLFAFIRFNLIDAKCESRKWLIPFSELQRLQSRDQGRLNGPRSGMRK